MINCKGCPFKIITFLNVDDNKISSKCALGYKIIKEISQDCRLDAVTYSLKDRDESINFVPKETDCLVKEVRCDE